VSKPPKKIIKACKKLVKAGQPVFPCHPTGEKAKRPMTKHGFKDATTDWEQIERWWSKRPDAAIGIPTGIIYDVLDVDVKADTDGRAHLPYLHRLGLLDGCVRLARTPSGGWHPYFPANSALTNKARGADLGLDVRAGGGYVLASPSYVNDGDRSVGYYEDLGPTEEPAKEPLLWDLIVSALNPINTTSNKPVELLPSERRASVAALREWLLNRATGERNNSLHWAVCRCIDNGIDPHEMVEPALYIGLAEDEVLLTIQSALKRAGVKAKDLNSEAEAMFPAL
jgi:hypothetical protein